MVNLLRGVRQREFDPDVLQFVVVPWPDQFNVDFHFLRQTFQLDLALYEFVTF